MCFPAPAAPEVAPPPSGVLCMEAGRGAGDPALSRKQSGGGNGGVDGCGGGVRPALRLLGPGCAEAPSWCHMAGTAVNTGLELQTKTLPAR